MDHDSPRVTLNGVEIPCSAVKIMSDGKRRSVIAYDAKGDSFSFTITFPLAMPLADLRIEHDFPEPPPALLRLAERVGARCGSPLTLLALDEHRAAEHRAQMDALLSEMRPILRQETDPIRELAWTRDHGPFYVNEPPTAESNTTRRCAGCKKPMYEKRKVCAKCQPWRRR